MRERGGPRSAPGGSEEAQQWSEARQPKRGRVEGAGGPQGVLRRCSGSDEARWPGQGRGRVLGGSWGV